MKKQKSGGLTQGKKTKGTKRHIIVDTLGLLLEVLVHSAGIQDTNGAKQVVQKLAMKHINLRKLFADGGYKEKFIDWAKVTHDLEIEVVKRNEQHKFVVLPKRWVVERTFSWLIKNRRLAKDYERLKQSAESMIYIAMTRLMLKRLALAYN